MRDAENQVLALTPLEFWLDVTLLTRCCSESKTPSADSSAYSTMTATSSTMNAISEITKLNFMTDHGSIRAMVRCACRVAVRRTDALGRGTPNLVVERSGFATAGPLGFGAGASGTAPAGRGYA